MGFKPLWLCFCGLLLITACSRHKTVLTDKEYLELGRNMLAEKEYVKARQAFEDLESNYPDSELLARARLAGARSYYDDEGYGEAAVQYRRFLRFHPRNHLADEARFFLAMSYFKQRLTIDRDTSDTRQALREFEDLIDLFPKSEYAGQAREKAAVCLNELAEHEYYVGNFYFKQKQYEAAGRRFRGLLTDFPQSDACPKALFYLAESHWHLEMREEARRLFILYLEKHGEHHLAKKARARLEEKNG